MKEVEDGRKDSTKGRGDKERRGEERNLENDKNKKDVGTRMRERDEDERKGNLMQGEEEDRRG